MTPNLNGVGITKYPMAKLKSEPTYSRRFFKGKGNTFIEVWENPTHMIIDVLDPSHSVIGSYRFNFEGPELTKDPFIEIWGLAYKSRQEKANNEN